MSDETTAQTNAVSEMREAAKGLWWRVDDTWHFVPQYIKATMAERRAVEAKRGVRLAA